MRSIPRLIYLIVLFLFISTLTNATNYYVDKNASGQNNGTSWANAWQSFSAINWGSIEPGDYLYISGGADSTMYYEQLEILDVHGTAANWITVRNSYEAGHNGRVIIDGNNFTLGNGIVLGTGTSTTSSYIYIKGFEIRHMGTSGYAGITIRYPNNCITIDSCLIYDNRRESVHIFGTSPAGRNDLASATDSVTVKNCFLMNTLADANSGQQDQIQADAVTNTFIDNNVFHIRRTPYDLASHNDGIQALGTMGWRITNNFFIMDSAAYTQANILSAYDYIDAKMDSVIYYNNVFFDGGTWASPDGTGDGTVFFMKLEFANPSGTQTCPIVAIHNTIVSHGPNYKAIVVNASRDLDYFKNNIVAQFGDGDDDAQDNNYKIMYESGHPVSDSINLDKYRGNLWYRERKTEWSQPMFSNDSWSGGGNAEVTSMNSIATMNSKFKTSDIEAGPVFQHDFSYGNHRQSSIDEYGLDDFRAGLKPQFWMPQSNSPAVDAGEDLQAIVERMGLSWTDINGNPRDNTPTIGAYEYDAGPDLTPPTVIGATLLDSITLVVNFSEALDEITAEDENNYSISNNIEIFNASLSGKKVTLQTSTHSPGSYIVTVVNVKDLAGNPIAQSNTAEYEYIFISPDSLIMLPIQNVEGVIQDPNHTPLKTIDGLGALDGDPDSRWAAEPMPEELIFDLGSNKTVCKTKLSFYRWNYGRVYTYSILISIDNNNWVTTVSQATSAPQEEWTIDEFPAVGARYVKVHFTNNNQNEWAGLWECEIWGINSALTVTDPNGLPNEFSLQQNYPNPFNPTTTIRYSIPLEGLVILKVYNTIGEEVIILANEVKQVGNYEVEFDASNLPSGIYFYRLQAGSFLETKKMVLMK